jgi:hypothetical protein
MKAVQANPNQVSYSTAICGYCSRTDQILQECARCHFIGYCDRDCQAKDWPKHKLVCHLKYVQVVQDGAAILFKNTIPKNLHYLSTYGLESCIAIMAKGEHGVVLLHDGGFLTENSIKAIFQKIGTLEFWATSANPNADIEYSKILPDEYQERYAETGEIYLTNIERIRQIMTAVDPNARSKQKKPDDSDYYRAFDKWACIDRNGKIYTETNSELDKVIRMKDPSARLRQRINELNSAMDAALQGKGFDCHLQFDGENLTPIPQLIHSEEAIQSIAQTTPLVAKLLNALVLAKAFI